MWETHLTEGSRSIVAEIKQASQLAQLSLLLSFVNVFAMLCRNNVLLAVLLHKLHHVVADLGFLQQHVFWEFMVIEPQITAD